jgi:hypothetical protein
MPRASMDKNYGFVFGEYDFRLAGKILHVEAITNPLACKNFRTKNSGLVFLLLCATCCSCGSLWSVRLPCFINPSPRFFVSKALNNAYKPVTLCKANRVGKNPF